MPLRELLFADPVKNKEVFIFFAVGLFAALFVMLLITLALGLGSRAARRRRMLKLLEMEVG